MKPLSFLLLGLSVAYNLTRAILSPYLDPNLADVGYARYLGNQSFPNTNAFLGIPYAEPPLGERRFRAPVPLNTSRVAQESAGRVVDASNYPDFCIQGTTGGGDAGGAGTEDCLKVNIYAPVGATKRSKFPVLVYIHGGGYVYGNPRNWPFDHWIHQSPNVVIVSVYYRLDSFGFLSVPEFNDPAVGDFNVGFQDQIEALRWVKQHIEAFGGDPARVTINGESAGGSSVELHLVTQVKGQPLFSGAIAQSVYRTPLPTPEQQRPLFDFYATRAGCGNGTVAQKVACLRQASVSTLARAQDAGRTSALSSAYNVFHPVLDGKLITRYPTKSVLAGRFAPVPLIVGATSNESLSGGEFDTALKTFFPLLTDQDIAEFLHVYPLSAFDSEAQRVQVAIGQSQLICARSILGEAFSARTNTWTYRYNQRNPTGNGISVGHAAENWMMFLGSNTGLNGSTTFTQMTPVEVSFAEELIAYWLSFVRSGDPNTHKLARSPIWPQYSALHRARVVLQQEPSNASDRSGNLIELEPADETSRCKFVASKVDREQN